MINVKKLNDKQLAREYIIESEYVHDNCGRMNKIDYERKINYINALRKELFERNINEYKEMKELAEIKK